MLPLNPARASDHSLPAQWEQNGGALTGTAFNFVGKKQMPLRVVECQESEGGVAQENSDSLGYAAP